MRRIDARTALDMSTNRRLGEMGVVLLRRNGTAADVLKTTSGVYVVMGSFLRSTTQSPRAQSHGVVD
jgi:hypothetical protein